MRQAVQVFLCLIKFSTILKLWKNLILSELWKWLPTKINSFSVPMKQSLGKQTPKASLIKMWGYVYMNDDQICLIKEPSKSDIKIAFKDAAKCCWCYLLDRKELDFPSLTLNLLILNYLWLITPVRHFSDDIFMVPYPEVNRTWMIKMINDNLSTV